jgi:hypothetical protein
MPRTSWKVTRVYGTPAGTRFANVQHASGQTVSVRIRGSKDGRLLNAWGDPYPYEETRRPRIVEMAARQAVEEDAARDAARRRANPRRQAKRTANRRRANGKRTPRKNPSAARAHAFAIKLDVKYFQGYAEEIRYLRELDGAPYKHKIETDAAELYLAHHPDFGNCLLIVDPSGRTPLWK